MKIIGKQKRNLHDGNEKIIWFLFIPLVKTIKTKNKYKKYFCGIRVIAKDLPNYTIVNNNITQYTNNSQLYLTELLNKALEKNLRDMKQFQLKTEKRLIELEHAVKKQK